MPAAPPTLAARSVVLTSVLTGVAVFLVVLGGLLAWAALREDPSPSTGRRLVSRFPDVVQDQGHSVPLPDGRTLWIFADTAQIQARPRFFVTSSAGVTKPGSLRVEYLTDPRGVPAEFLPRTPAERARRAPEDGYTAVWPTGATTLPDGRILVAYSKYQVQDDPQRFTFLAGGLFAYRYPGAEGLDEGRPARRIAHDLWKPPDGSVASPVHSGSHVYFTQCQDGRCYSARAPIAGVTDRAAYRWWTGTGWSERRADRRPMTYGSDHPGRNPPTAYLPSLGVYATVDTSSGIASDAGLIWVAPRPWGPWSRAAQFPLPGCTKRDGCYTLNVHASGSAARSVRVSYATAHEGPHVLVDDVPVAVGAGGRSVTVRRR